MAISNIKSVNLLPVFLQTDRNAKFLSSTIDQLIQPTQLERLDGYVGSTLTPTYDPLADVYIPEKFDLRRNYQLAPALVVNDSQNTIQDVQGLDDLINEISIKGGLTDNLDRLLRSETYSYDGHFDWDKLVNYQDYYWLSNGPDVITIATDKLDPQLSIEGKVNYTTDAGINLSNGMLVTFSGKEVPAAYFDKEFFVEGVGSSIVLVDRNTLITSANVNSPYTAYSTNQIETFDSVNFDTSGFDSSLKVMVSPEYVTINRASIDLNPWSRANRWVHKDVIAASTAANGFIADFPADKRAKRAIIEFDANIQLFNFGTIGLKPVDLIDTVTTNAFVAAEGSTSTFYIGGVLVENGHRVIFNADEDPNVRNTIFEATPVVINGYRTLTLVAVETPAIGSSVSIVNGTDYAGSSWWFDGDSWKFAQQKTELNQSPLFDLYDNAGHSYGDINYYSSNFTGNKIIGYKIGSGNIDPYLKFPLSYRNTNAVGSFVLTNYLTSNTIRIAQSDQTNSSISTNLAYCKISTPTGTVYKNSWVKSVDYQIPIITTPVSSYYEEPLSLTNNPLNSIIPEFTISELSQHLQTIITKLPGYEISNTNAGNLRDLSDYTTYGTELITTLNPIAFSQMFIGKKEHNIIDVLSRAGDQYNQFKFTFLNNIAKISNQLDPIAAVDQTLTTINKDKTFGSSYYLSDMLGYGTDKIVKSWTVSDARNKIYPLLSEFSLNKLVLRSVLIYRNGTQLIHSVDYQFDELNSTVEILTTLKVNDVLDIVDYIDTTGIFIPPTPSKLGLYPKFVPSKYLDTTYVTPVQVIQGHDGSIMVAYNDFRDDIIIELEKRIYNNIKAEYNPELINVDTIFPGAFRTSKYSLDELNKIIQQDFVRWAGQYGVDYTSHADFNLDDPHTWNYADTNNTLTKKLLSGSWRSVFKFFYNTDRPHSHPWEMLLFREKPSWWETQYGPAPYARNNEMWNDIEHGRTVQGPTQGINPLLKRPGLSNIIPVNLLGELLDPVSIQLVSNYTAYNAQLPWVAGDQGPAETAWRRSSYWPFAVQRLLALTSPSTYSTLMYDPSRIQKNIAGQWTYGTDKEFFKLSKLFIHEENNSLTSGYSVLLSEIGQQRTTNYISELRQDLSYVSYNLFHKVGGFVNKNTLQVIINAYEPTSTSPGAILPQENYTLRLNVSNPVKSVGISGFIIQKINNGFVVKGYDKTNPYFTYFSPVRNSNTPTITIGGVSEPYVMWASDPGTTGATGLTSVDLTTANSSVTGKFYQAGQIVYYGNNFYRVQVSHRAESTFNPSYYQIMQSLPTIGGATVQIANRFDNRALTVSYGTVFSSLQEIYDLIVGYGKWLESQGFVFDEFNKDLNTVIDWNLTSKEFLFWTTQNWAENSIITLSPFADQIKYEFIESVVDNIFDSFYEYSLLKADGTPYPQNSLSISRNDGICTIGTLAGSEGIYFARLNSVQKEHAMVFDNKTIFGDVVYQPETGNRQRRMKLVGFRTANWNGDYFSPGFVYDSAQVSDWKKYTDYNVGDVIRFNGNYYSAIKNINGASSFDIEQIANSWNILGKKPVAGLLPNFDYKINQFEDFYSLDIDNFDAGQQKMAQHLTGYTPRIYLNNIFTNPISQYKFYQGFIREKGTKNAITKLAKASIQNLQGEISYNEEWAFRVGQYGSYSSYQELEVPLIEGTFIENPQIINFVDTAPSLANDLIHYSVPSDLQITPDNYVAADTFSSVADEDKFLLTHSGYVRIDDVTATAYNENSLLDIANNNQLTNGDTIWLGFKQDGGWDVYRYIYAPVDVIGVYVSAPVSEITFTTRLPHGLSVGDIISVSQFNDQVNGVYIVKLTSKSTQFTVASSLSSITNSPLETPGQLYRFASARLTEFDLLPSDKELYKLPTGTKFWIDPSTTTGEGWAVYEKTNNYSSANFYTIPNIAGQGLGKSISKRKGNNVVIVGAPTYQLVDGLGEIFVYRQTDNNKLTDIVRYKFGEYSGATEFGHCVVYDDISFNSGTYGLVFAGAPAVYNSVGAVKISSINAATLDEGTSIYLSNPESTSQRFGSSIFVQRNTSTKLVLIGAPNTATSVALGSVYSCIVSNNHGSIAATSLTTLIDNSVPLTTGSQWGYSISGSDDASFIAVSAPGYSTGTGLVTVFNKSLVRLATLSSPFGQNSRFGETVLMSPNGSYLFVSAPSVINDDESYGQVVVYKNTNGTFLVDQILENPIATQGMKFGKAMDINTLTDTLIISATGINHTFKTKFDNNLEVFDNNVTLFSGTELNSGAVYIYNRKNNRFVLANELVDDRVASIQGTDYGTSIVIDDNEVIIGSPAYNNPDTYCGIYQFNIIDPNVTEWNKIRQQQNLVDVNVIQKVYLIDTFNEEIVEYLDVIDPLKGKIAGIAEQELSYKLISDPAIYSIGLAGTVNDTDTNWLDSHVGELWWDLSTAKYIWYEQSDLEYRRNNWGRLFPGATIDVYEWVGSVLLPSEWSTQADTPAGLAKGISGQPKFSDNSVVSVKQVYDAISNSFSNVYFYWVKNKITVPDTKNRRISSYQVASTIADPVACGLQFVSIIDRDAVSLANIAATLVDSRISLNISQDISSDIHLSTRHTEWLLLQENSANSMPNSLLEKKLIDSLVGHDTLGNLVPNPALSDRTKYGISIRPQQSFFKDRLTALRNIIEFTNSVLLDEQITGKYNFINLNAQEELPTIYSGEYDIAVEDNQALKLIDTSTYQQALIQCNVNTNGQITSTDIINAGAGYGTLNPVLSNDGIIIGYTGPTLTFDSTTGVDGNISTIVNENGQVISATIINYGIGYMTNFVARARPHTAIVLSDSTFDGKWTIYNYDIGTHLWARAHTQKYNTSLYWKYIDWFSKDYNKYQEYSYTIGSTYELDKLSLVEGQYVKILNEGDGRSIIVKKLSDNTVGTFGLSFDLMYSQNGTIQILDSIWDLYNNKFGFDYNNSYDQTQWDQTADIELQYLLTALKNDIFVNELKVNWNLLFFKAVRYALTEQKLLDWAFKTSFINVTNNAGTLDQRPVYKLQDSKYYEQYIGEIKPYHTKIRNFNTLYSVLEPTNTLTTDFDLPDYYNTDNGRFETVNLDNPLIDTYPWKSWKDNHLPANNNPVRKVNTTLKFDRISKVRQIGNAATYDKFIGTGKDLEFVLNWPAYPDKTKIVVSINGIIQLNSDYTIHYFSKPYQTHYNDYKKQYTKVEFLNFFPPAGSLIKISYEKSSELFTAAERILNSYVTTSTLPGVELAQLMSGIEYPGLIIGDLYSKNINSYVDPDSLINGGSLTSGQLISAQGINPEDVTLDGEYGFITPNTSYAPEEFVPGHVLDSLGINVYTKAQNGTAIVINRNVIVEASTGTISQFSLPELPTTIDNILVILNGKILEYVEDSMFSSSTQAQFSIDWSAVKLVIPPQDIGGVVGYSIIGVSGGSGFTAGVIDKASVSVIDIPTAQVRSLASADTVKSAFVTVNGRAISEVTTTSNYGYMFAGSSVENKRESIEVYNLPLGKHTIQAWFFAESRQYFNTIHEQEFVVTDSVSTDIPFVLDFPPGTIEPASSQSIVEITDDNGTRRLLPPNVNYYSVTDPLVINYPVTVVGIYQLNTDTLDINNDNVKVYRQGISLIPGFDYSVDNVNKVVTINTGNLTLKVGDAIAIESYNPTVIGTGTPVNYGTNYIYNYRIQGSNLYLAPGAQSRNGTFESVYYDHGLPAISSATIKVITYTDSDNMLLNTERFTGNYNRRFTISRPAINDDYIWVTMFVKDEKSFLTTIALINKIDYIVLDDNATIQLSDRWAPDVNTLIEITSFSSHQLSSNVLGYRIFSDMTGKTTFTRLSAKNSTYLTQSLKFTDTQIFVNDATVLTDPLPDQNMPGVVLISGERIEFFQRDGSILSQLRRATLGTAPSYFLEAGTKIIDQGLEQIVPYTETTRVQNTFTNTLTNIYSIGKVDAIQRDPADNVVRYDGIVLSTASASVIYDPFVVNTISSVINPTDQLNVYYGGRKLRKTGFYYHETTATFDSISLSSIKGSTSTLALLPVTPKVGDAYMVTDINQVWVYTGLRFESTASGYVYSGLKFAPPEFSVIAGASQQLILNTSTITLTNDIKLLIVKKEFSTIDSWNTIDPTSSTRTISLLDSNTRIAKFLQDAPAELPDSHYYGTDLELTDEFDNPLVDDQRHDLQVYY